MGALLLVLTILFPGAILGGYIPPGPKYKCPNRVEIWPCQCTGSTDDGLHILCEDVSLATASSAMNAIKSFGSPLEEVTLLKLNAFRLYGRLFEGLDITRLLIIDSPFESVTSDFFYHIRNSLKILDLRNTKLIKFPSEALAELRELERLLISGHRITSLSEGISDSFQNLTDLQLSNGDIKEITKASFAKLGRLTRLDLHGNDLEDLPRDAFNSQKNLVFLDLSHNRFQKLNPTYFAQLNKLTWVNCSHNLITSFNRGAFARNSALRVITLTHNKIDKLDAAAFRGMRLLRRLYLSDNQISEVGRSAFNSLAQVGTIDLARNRLKIIDYQMFSQLKQAELIDISENQIIRIGKGAFRDLAYLAINMSHNEITILEPEAFVNCINITVLDMSNNQIENFTRGVFDEYTYPTEWRLSFNKLRKTGDIPLKMMTGIKSLNVSHNTLDEITKNTFPKLYEMHSIDLSHNNISKIAPSFLQNLLSLRFLDLSFNSLTDLRGSAFGAISTLIDLKLNNNHLKTISNAALTRLASLRELDASQNQLNTIFQIPPSLIYLNLSFNEITSMKRAWPTMNSLLRLDLSHNKLGGHLEQGSFSNLGSVQRLNLSSNGISEVPTEALADLTTVQYLDLSFNSIRNLTKKIFGRLPIVFELLLGSNQISSIEIKSFEGFLQMLHLDLSNNSLSEIPVGAFATLASLRLLNLSRNALDRCDNGSSSLFAENLSIETIDLSRNKFGQITSYSFPESPWIPYRLMEINLSHNLIRWISRDLLYGTRKMLRRLDLSHNKISEIKPGILGNITKLEELHLEGNALSFLDGITLGPPPNLTKLWLGSNYLRKYPTESFAKAPLTLLDLSGNRITQFDTDFLTKIKNGSRISLRNNPLGCDCRLIPLKRLTEDYRPQFYNYSKEYMRDLQSFQCSDEGVIKYLKDLGESDLKCDYYEDPLAPKPPPRNDVEIRSFTQKGGSLDIIWRVKGFRDVAGFQLRVLNGQGEESFTQSLDYDQRRAQVNLNTIRGAGSAGTVCLSPRFSRREENEFAPSACQKIDPDSLSGSIRLLNPGVFLILIWIKTVYFFV